MCLRKMFKMEGAEHCYISQTHADQLLITENFELGDEFKTLLRDIPSPFKSEMAQLVYYRTYSRKLSNGGNEKWADTIIRVIEGTISAYLTHMKRNHLAPRKDIREYAERMAMSAFERKWLPPGRGLYCMGTDFVKYRGNASLNNCYAVSTKEDLVKSAAWAMDMLMCGGGVGFDTTWNGECIIPNKEDNFLFVVPDSRQGWVAALELLLRAYIPVDGDITNKYPVFDFSQVRKYGEPIKGFGGTASGPEPLRVMLRRVESFCDAYGKFKRDSSSENLKLIYKEMLIFLDEHNAYDTIGKIDINDIIEKVNVTIDKNYKLKLYNHTRFVTDIFNVIASCVVAGNVRRSSEIAIGDAGHDEKSDTDCDIFITLKNYSINPERIMWGWNSNNTVRYHTNKEFEKWMPKTSELVKINGEPGMLNMINVGKYGRYSDTSRVPDPAILVNPCGEICLCSYEPCTLAIVCPYNCREDMEVGNSPLVHQDILDAGEYATFYAMAVTTIPHHWPDSNAIIAKNRRIGVSFSGVTNIYENYGQHCLTTLARHLYHHIDNINIELANHAGIPRSIRITTIKPEGTSSLITELNPGIHFAVEKYAIRRVVLADNSPLVPAFRRAGYYIEDSVYTPNTKVISVPLYSGNGRSADEVSMFEQFGLLMSMQRHWSDNSCSATVTFKKNTEGDTVNNAIAMFVPELKTVSLLGKEDDGSVKGYKQLPFERITKEQYLEMLKPLKPINWNRLYDLGRTDGIQPRFCTNDSCEL